MSDGTYGTIFGGQSLYSGVNTNTPITSDPNQFANSLYQMPQQQGGMPMAINMPNAPTPQETQAAQGTLQQAQNVQNYNTAMNVSSAITNPLQQTAAKGQGAGQQMVTQAMTPPATPGMVPLQSLNLNSPTYKTIFGS